MRDERQARAAKRQFARLVSLLREDLWTEADRAALEVEFGETISAREGQSFYSAATDVFDRLIVEAIAESIDAGVSQRDLIDARGWLSLNDMRDYIDRARKPHSYDYQPTWPQAQFLRTVGTDVARVARTDPEEAARLLRAAKSFLRRWVRQIPSLPSEEQLSRVASRWRTEHIALWKQARTRLIKEVNELAMPKDVA